MDVDVDVGTGDLPGLLADDRALPALGVAEEELHDLGVARSGVRQRVVLVDMGSDTWHVSERSRFIATARGCFPPPV
ncbi:hypothetical protein Plo01_17670 [Planobispora longispora]|uniref:Uncharacterized protein n=1 Tax=Planobispora longispora TaxID=28887 RepID=A0A8J3RI44_9ACTN|nr:hypothetical protein GCM10020093_075480 [Planobispora longispora]GIH75338.1 hypothetical protein Plo01_17670 [Planobispora longispora]